MFIFLKFETFSNSRSGAIAEPFRENCSSNREIKIFSQYLTHLFTSQMFDALSTIEPKSWNKNFVLYRALFYAMASTWSSSGEILPEQRF